MTDDLHGGRLFAVDERLADQVWRFWKGDHAEIVGWLQWLGCTLVTSDVSDDYAEYHLDGLTGVRVGLLYGPHTDPTSVAISFGFLLAGPFWPYCYPKALELVQQNYSAEVKVNRPAKRKPARKAAAA